MSDAVKKVIQNYINGTFTGDVELLASAFHKDAIMTGYLGPQLVIATPSVFIDEIRNNQSMQSQGHPYKAEITAIKEVGGIAQAVVHETGMWGEGEVEEFFQLLKDEDGGWKIISKCFITIPSAV